MRDFKIPKGYFIFSKAQKAKEDLEQWEQHFKERNINTIIVESKGKFYLLREGVESLS